MKRSVAAPEKDGIFKSPLLAALRPFSVHTPAFFLLVSMLWSTTCFMLRNLPPTSSIVSLSLKRLLSRVIVTSALHSSAAKSRRPAKTLCISAHSYSCSSPLSFISQNSLHSPSRSDRSTTTLPTRPLINSCLAGFNWGAAAAASAAARAVAALSAIALASSRSTMNPDIARLLPVTLASMAPA